MFLHVFSVFYQQSCNSLAKYFLKYHYHFCNCFHILHLLLLQLSDAVLQLGNQVHFNFLKEEYTMSFPSTQFATSRRMGIYEPNHQISMWGHAFKSDNSPNTGISTIVEADGKLDNGVLLLSFAVSLFSKLI